MTTRADGCDLGTRRWTDIDRPVVVVPVGSCEQHGPHLPLDTDTTIAVHLATALADRRPQCLVAPPLAITASGEHHGFPGTLSIGTEIMAGVAIELVRSADWADGVVFVNGHGGNHTAMQRASDVFDHERRNVLVWWPHHDRATTDGDLHAGHSETSLMLALAPQSVRPADARPGPVPALIDLVRHGVRALSETGVLGDPTAASGDHGRELVAELTTQLLDGFDDWYSRLHHR